ncbi:hypothetical protein M405DRAFT_885790 [Rhizopogon salebrosus TDB-379]|nr:hypothetical protein M405DRAFT_885790 [Rhizopogon salebrosus TDB-379]
MPVPLFKCLEDGGLDTVGGSGIADLTGFPSARFEDSGRWSSFHTLRSRLWASILPPQSTYSCVVLHDWPDARTHHVLLNTPFASCPEMRLVIAELILPLACIDEDEHQMADREEYPKLQFSILPPIPLAHVRISSRDGECNSGDPPLATASCITCAIHHQARQPSDMVEAIPRLFLRMTTESTTTLDRSSNYRTYLVSSLLVLVPARTLFELLGLLLVDPAPPPVHQFYGWCPRILICNGYVFAEVGVIR